ncbi:MAG TPA: TM2 domain-containing protein [Bacteroidia bacterium]|jgi:hypothetical protein|nr:TM2 domain-containing protein [Bacteroidia bacterium]
MKKLFFFFLLFTSARLSAGGTLFIPDSTIISHDTVIAVNENQHKDSVSTIFVHPVKENKKVVAAILAFPVPFGVLGLHRIYLGTEPWVPVVYILTLGGFGIIPLVDFIEIITSDDATFATYEHNPKVFMWGK